MDKQTNRRLSSFMTKILRHSPGKFEVDVDEKGFADIEDLIKGMQRDSRWKRIDRETINYIVETSEKKRFEIEGNKIRARYGHSFPVIHEKTHKELPAFLYHGTGEERLLPIVEKAEGIRPMGRQYVHLSETKNFATLAAKRRKKPCLLKIDTDKALLNGTTFHFAGNEVWLSTEITAEAIINTKRLNS